MGLLKAALQGTRSTLADQWKEFIYCDDLPQEVLMRKGQKRTGPGSSNTKGSDNIITQGSAMQSLLSKQRVDGEHILSVIRALLLPNAPGEIA